MPKKENKYVYLYVVQGNYGYGWDDLVEHESYKDAMADKKAYMANDSVPIRMIKRRELKSEVTA